MKTLVLFVSIIASCVHITAFLIYNYKLIFGKSKPNIITWFLWACLALLNLLSYKSMSQNWVLSLLPASGSAMCILTFIVAWTGRNFSKIAKIDYIALFFGTASIIVWKIFDSAMYANFIVLFGVSIAFIPTYRNVLRNPRNEPPLPWLLWGIAFFVGTIVVMVEFDGKWENFAYPVSMLILHLGVFKFTKK